MSQTTGDMQAWCYYQFNVCDAPPLIQINESDWFSPKPEGGVAPQPSGETINVLHLSDWHLDPRYDIGSEANCTSALCCRPDSINTVLGTGSSNASVLASRFGSLLCDTPADLALSVFTEMPNFVNMSDISFSIFTGDIVSHDLVDQLSRAYVEYEEVVSFQTFQAWLGNIVTLLLSSTDLAFISTLGNHDSLPEAFNTPNSLRPGPNEFSWNYELLSSLWLSAGWINASTASYSATHYGAYAYTTPQGLKIVSLNTDFWYVDNVFSKSSCNCPLTVRLL